MMKKRKMLLLTALLLAAMFVFCGCGGSKKPVSAVGSSAPDSTVAGYFSGSQSVSGGTDLRYINLKYIDIKKQASDTVVVLTFKDGSMQMGMQEVDTKGVPKYSTQWISGLNRLVLNINGLTYWDYTVYEDELKDTPILGIFKQIPVDDPETMLTKLYISLKDNIAYKIEEKGNELSIYLRATPTEKKTDFYVLLNAFDEYTAGKISNDEGLFPTLCKDKKNVTLISSPFATESDANAFKTNINTNLIPKLPGTVVSVVQLENNELPDYDESGALNAFANMTVTRTNGSENTADVLVSNGKILCWQPDGRAYVFSNPFPMGSVSGQETKIYEKLYMNNVDSSTPTLLFPIDFGEIYNGEFSEDGRYLAFLEQGDANRTLYVYDTTNKNNQVLTTTEYGFGMDTASFTWGSGEYADTLYALSGEDDTLQLMSFKMGDVPHALKLVENPFTQGDMGFFEGKVYYSQSGDDETPGGIWSYDVTTPTQAVVRVCDGCNFVMNRRTGIMAVQVSIDGYSYDLSIFDPRSKMSSPILKNRPVAQCVWSNDGSTLYYTVYKDDVAENDRFILTLSQYSTLTHESIDLTDIAEGVLNPSDKSSEVMLTCRYPQNNQYVTITYRVSVSK